MNTKTVYISERERYHILSALQTGLQVKKKDYSQDSPSNDLLVVLSKLGLLDKDLKNMERSDIMKYECLRKKMKEVRCNAKQLLQSDEISMAEMRTIIKNLNQISRKMKEMSKKLGSRRFMVDELTDSDGSDHSCISIKKKKGKVMSQAEFKKKTQCGSANMDGKDKYAKHEEFKNNSKVVSSKSTKQTPNTCQTKNHEGTKCVSRSKIADIFSDKDCFTKNDQQPQPEPSNPKGSYITKYSKSNDHQHHCYDGLVVETCSKCLCRRWSIPSVNRNSLKTYIKKNIKNNGHRGAVKSTNVRDCTHSCCRGRRLEEKDDFVALPGLIPPERKHLTAVRNKILKENACCSGTGVKNKSSSGCCFNSNTDLEIFETSDTSLNKNEDPCARWSDIFDTCSTKYKGENNVQVPSACGATQWDGERNQAECSSDVIKRKPEKCIEATGKNKESGINVCKCQSAEKMATKKKWTERLDKSIQSACPKVSRCTSYDNFVLHPQFSWSMPMIGQAFRKTIPLAQEKWHYFDKCGKFIRPSKPSTDTGTTTKKPRNILVMDRSVQTNDMLYTKNMHQVMYLNVVYTKTHLRYIVPNSMEMPILSQTPKVIERRAIDNGYAVTTYKADRDGVIHFTLAYSDGHDCKTDSSGLPSEANRRLCQLKNLWISSARKFFSQLNEKLVGESGDFEERNPCTNSLVCGSDYSTSSPSRSEASDSSTKTNDTES